MRLQDGFGRLWAADALSQVGTRVGHLALPLVAVLALGASDFEVTLVKTAQTAAYLVVGLQAGAWVDRMRCKSVLVWADVGRFALYVSIPVAAAFGVLGLGQLLAVVFLAGACTVFFDVAAVRVLPQLVGRDQLIQANARLKGNASVAAVAAPGLGGAIVQKLGAPAAVLVDSLTYLWSALWLRTMRVDEPDPGPRRNLRREIGEGARTVFGDPVLRAIGLHSASMSFFQNMNLAVLIVFLVRDVGLSPGLIGVLSGLGLVGAVVGSLVAARWSAAVGPVRLMVVALAVEGVAYLLYPLTGTGWRLGFFVAGGLLASLCVILVLVVQTSMQQTRCPERLLGRVTATMNVLYWGVAPLGSLAAGGLVVWLGFRPTLWIAGAGVLLSTTWIVCSPIRRMKGLPDASGT